MVGVVWLDTYERRARLVPGLLLVAPVAIVVVMFGLRSNPVVSAILGALTAFGAPLILANFVRHRGVAAQDALYASWGGKPTTELLETGTTARARRWRAAAQQVTGERFPETDEPDPEGRYDAAVATLISKTRDARTFPMVFNENCNYGYERNLYGLTALGRVTAAVCLAASGIAVGLLIAVSGRIVRAEWVIGLVALAALLIVWIALPSSSRARVTAYKYAEQLLDAGVELAANASPESA